MSSTSSDSIRNIAIIAHVDHGKTTLVDAMFRQSVGQFKASELAVERVMDSNDLEREKGITIFSKHASIRYRDVKINLVDTPGHSDFGSEVERVLRMVDGVLLLVDAFDGPMPQTKFVLKKALQFNLKPIVVINKVDRPGARPTEVLDLTFDLFCDLNASDDQLDFPVIYCSAKNGTSSTDPASQGPDLVPLFEAVRGCIPPPKAELNAPFQMQVMITEYDNYIGLMAVGRIFQGQVKNGQMLSAMHRDGSRSTFRVTKLFRFEGLSAVESDVLGAGEIARIAGLEKIDIGETLADYETPSALPLIQVDEPTLSVVIGHNTSPLAGQDGGKFLTSRQVKERLRREARANIGYRIEEATDAKDGVKVSGRGELHLTILIETLRREGYEIEVSKPQVIFRHEQGQLLEPMQQLYIEADKAYQGFVIEQLGQRKAEITGMHETAQGASCTEAIIPDRTLLGFRSEFVTATKGTGIMHHIFHGYQPFKGAIPGRNKGVMISQEGGKAVAYALNNLQERGELFISPQTALYEGMVIGVSSKGCDMVVNPVREKKLTNMRAAGSDDAILLTPPRILTIEWALDFIAEDELLEVTPRSLRIRKKILSEIERKRVKPISGMLSE